MFFVVERVHHFLTHYFSPFPRGKKAKQKLVFTGDMEKMGAREQQQLDYTTTSHPTFIVILK